MANVGDSRTVLAAQRSAEGAAALVARDLSWDQTPFRADEVERVVAAGALVLTLDQVEGTKVSVRARARACVCVCVCVCKGGL